MRTVNVVLLIDGAIEEERREFSIGIGQATQEKHRFRVGDEISGESLSVANPRQEPVEFYKTSKLKLLQRLAGEEKPGPPWHGVAASLETYRQRGHRRLATRTYDSKCRSCVWGCRMAVEMIIDHWSPSQKRYRTETFCYGPKSCEFYKVGPTRKVPGRHGMVWEEPDWVDEDETAHRAWDE